MRLVQAACAAGVTLTLAFWPGSFAKQAEAADGANGIYTDVVDGKICSINEKTAEPDCGARAPRPRLIELPLQQELPRIHVDDLDLPENDLYRRRMKPFILTGAMDDWPLLKTWRGDYNAKMKHLGKILAREVTDFYPYNMLTQGTSPYLMRFSAALHELFYQPGRYTTPPTDSPNLSGRYAHLQLTPRTWKMLEAIGDLPKDRHIHTKGDQWWMSRCLKNKRVREEYHVKTHWKIVIIGSRGAGMFNHSDSLRTSSWHGHVEGRKYWIVCSGKRSGNPECFESILQAGEILYYGKDWFHTTQNIDTPTTTITGTVVLQNQFDAIADMLHKECAKDWLNFRFSEKLCDALDHCLEIWHEKFRGEKKPKTLWPPWRSKADAAILKKRKKIKPQHNNYDGRNYIGE